MSSRRLFTVLLAVVYLTVFPHLPGLNNPNENTRVYLTMALVDDHTVRLDQVVQRYGWTNDLARVPDGHGGRFYASPKGPLVSWLGVPAYALLRAGAALVGHGPPPPGPPADLATRERAKAWLRTTTLALQLICVHVPCLLFLLALERRLVRWSADPTLRLGTVAAVGLGTNYLAYSFLFASHALVAAAAFLALDALAVARLRARRRRAVDPRAALVAGLLAAAPTLLEYQGAALSVVLALGAAYLLGRSRALVAFAAGAALGAAALGLHHWRAFGGPLHTGVLYMENPAFAAVWRQGVLGLRGLDPGALRELLLDGGYGLLATSPWLVLGVVGAVAAPGLTRPPSPLARRWRRAELVMASGMVAALVVLVASEASWRGGWTIGPRYLGATTALLALPALALAEGLARRWPRSRETVRALFAGLALASFVRGGAIGLMVVTLPESIERPLSQLLLPFIERGVAPHHALHLLGWHGAGPWRLTALAAIGALVVATLAARARPLPRAARALGALLVAALLLPSALHLPPGHPDDGPNVRALFLRLWEPR